MQPIVLVTTDRRDGQGFADVPRVRPRRHECYLLEAYVEAVRMAGGLPLLVPPGPSSVDELLRVAHAVVLTGGDMDIHPSHYGQAVEGRLDRVEPGRTELELAIARGCLATAVPVLGVCGGMQVLAVAGGGTLVQDLATPTDGIAHEQPGDPAQPSHPVVLSEPGWLGLADPGGTEVRVNSTHHQAVDDPGPFVVFGRAPDGVIEAMALPGHPFAVGVQWHPELIEQLGPYRALVRAAQNGMSSSAPP